MKWLKQRLQEAILRSFNEEEGKPGIIGQVPISINVVIEKSKHAADRQFRHVDGDEKGGSNITGDVVDDATIMRVAQKAVPKIIGMVMAGHLDAGNEMVIKRRTGGGDGGNIINLVCVLEKTQQASVLNLRIITVMVKNNFFAKPGTKEIVLEDKLVGGEGDNKTPQDILKKWKESNPKLTIDQINDQIEMGIEVEKEHTKSKSKAREIAIDHIYGDDCHYYTKLQKAGIEEK